LVIHHMFADLREIPPSKEGGFVPNSWHKNTTKVAAGLLAWRPGSYSMDAFNGQTVGLLSFSHEAIVAHSTYFSSNGTPLLHARMQAADVT
jgi:hypothetical protein